MSYYETVNGAGKRGYHEGMGAGFTLTTVPSDGLRSIQQDLQRMGLLAAGTGATGADGRWGLRTAAALGNAATRLNWPAPPGFTTTNRGRNIDIPDDFIAAIHAAASPAAPPPGVAPPLPGAPPGAPPIVFDASTTGPITTTPIPPLVEETGSSNTRMYLMVGGGVLVLGGLAAFVMTRKKSSPAPAAVTANRRRRRMRSNRRRRYSRR